MKIERIGTDGDVYLTRITLAKIFGWEIRLHRFHRADADPCCHDHPCDFWTVPIWPLTPFRSGYVELVWIEELETHVVWRVVALVPRFRRAEHRHRVMTPSITINLAGPRRREWGFWQHDGRPPWLYHFVPWRTYLGIEGDT